MRSIIAGLLVVASAVSAGLALADEGPPERPDTQRVMFVGNNWAGTADIIDPKTYRRLARIDLVPDREERLAEIQRDPARLAFFLAIREAVGEGHDQYTDDMYTSDDGRFVYVSRPSLADVAGIELATGKLVWRFPMEGQRSDHMAVSPDGSKLLVSDSTANKVHQLDAASGRKTGEFPSGDSPHESVFSKDGLRIYHASIGRVYTPTDEPRLALARDTTKGARYFQVVDARTLEVVKRWDMGQKLEEAGFPDLEAAVRPMAITPDEKRVFLQVSFFHGIVEFDLESERVVRVADLPISDEARALRPEQYLLDSAHHGLAMQPSGERLCVAGTMSDYATIVDRATLKPGPLVPGEKPYWSTNGVDGNCWVSFSGSDEIAVIDYATGAERARVPVGDHPQRIRIGAVNRAVLRTLPAPAPAQRTDRTRPRVSVRVRRTGGAARCRAQSLSIRVRVRDASALGTVRVSIDGREVRRTASKSFTVRVATRRLRRGSHRLRVLVVDAAGNRRVVARRVLACGRSRR